MEVKHTGQNDNNPLAPPVNNDRLKNVIRFYSLKFHFIIVPITLIIAIVHLRFAVTYLNQCPMQPMINIYMIVHAAVHLSIMLLTFLSVINIRCIYPHFQYHHQTVPRVILIFLLIFTVILHLFSLAWLITGSVWIFGAKTNGVQGSDPTDTTRPIVNLICLERLLFFSSSTILFMVLF